MGRLDGLNEDEQGACLIAERSLGVVAEAWDVGGRRGAVDAMLTYPDGRRAAFEVVKLAAEGVLHTEHLLARDNHIWPLPGRWSWSIAVGSQRDIPRLQAVYENIIRSCEAADVEQPHVHYGWLLSADPDVKWLVQESSSRMLGNKRVPATEMAGAILMRPARAGVVNQSMSGFTDGLSVAFEQPHMPRHFEKLAKAEGAERHLFIILHDSVLPFSIASELMFDHTIPPEAPPLPNHVTHLWLADGFSRRVLLWNSSDGWRNFYPYDN